MTQHSITLDVPAHIYRQASEIARQTARPVEAILLDYLASGFADPLAALPEDERSELAALAYLSDEALWTIAREQMAAAPQARMQTLMQANSRGTISFTEYEELGQLVEDGQRLMVRKAQAARLLTERGFTVRPEDMASSND